MHRPVLALCALAFLLPAGCSRAPKVADAPPVPSTPVASQESASAPSSEKAPSFSTRPLVGDVPLLEQLNRENVRVVAAASPAIVRISSMVPVDPHAQFLDLPFKIPGLPNGVRTVVPSYGSGVVISKDGLVVTNYHVIEDARSIDVQTHDGTRYPAQVLASDKDTDLAVLKVVANDLPVIPWGDSDRVDVGEQVFAIGNPFNLDTSVSKGIVSGKGRSLPESNSYEDYIQTDAAINVGNSGGALVNIHGELIGINAAIASFTRGNEGVGFSIPSNLVRATVEQLLKAGRLVRGYLGVRLPSKIDEGVPEALGLMATRGALLAGIQPSSPAEQAKLRPVDFITEVDGHKIESVPQFRLVVAQIPIGKEVTVNFIRGGSAKSARVKIAELPKEPEAPEGMPAADAEDAATGASTAAGGDEVLSGVQVTDLNGRSRQKFGVDEFVATGVVVTEVVEGSPADTHGLQRGDVIEIACAQRGAIKTIQRPADFTTLTGALKADQNVVLLVHHGRMSGAEDRSSNFVCLTPDAPPKSHVQAAR
jgi:serine protease Do